MSSPNPLSYNQWVQVIGSLAVEQVAESGGVYAFVSAPLQALVAQILNYAEGRIQKDLDLLANQTSNTYTLTPGIAVFPLPIGDFTTVQTLEIVKLSNGQVVTSCPLTPVSKEFIQNCYSGLTQSSMPRFYAMYGDNFGDEGDSYTNILLGPPPNYGYTLRVTGTATEPSLYTNASNGPADSTYTYISNYYPDLLITASMIMVSAYQRNWSATADDPKMAQSYEAQYEALAAGAKILENRRKGQASSWTAYSTPSAATPTR